jgi:hypothetical protein
MSQSRLSNSGWSQSRLSKSWSRRSRVVKVAALLAVVAVPTAAIAQAQSSPSNPIPTATAVGAKPTGATPIFPSSSKDEIVSNATVGFNKELTFRPITACRIMDTRNAGGALAAGESRPLRIYSTTDFRSTGGAASCANVGASPNAFVFNIATTGWASSGWLTFYPHDQSGPPNVSTMNFPGSIPGNANALANGAVVVGCPSCVQADLKIFASASTHVIVDLIGWMDESDLNVQEVEVQQNIGAGGSWAFEAICPSPMAVVGGGVVYYGADDKVSVWESRPRRANNSYKTSGRNLASVPIQVIATAECLAGNLP